MIFDSSLFEFIFYIKVFYIIYNRFYELFDFIKPKNILFKTIVYEKLDYLQKRIVF